MRITALVVGTVGVGSAMVGGWGWAFAIAAWTIAVFLMLQWMIPWGIAGVAGIGALLPLPARPIGPE